MLKCYEFVPFELGTPVRSQRLADAARHTCAESGWTDITAHFSQLDVRVVVPNCVGIFKKQDVLCYIAESGYGVLRVDYSYTSDSEYAEAVQALIGRIKFQQAIERGDIPDSVAEGKELIVQLREQLDKKSRLGIRAQVDGFFTYSLSAFITSSQNNERLISALLHPRDVGCSISQATEELPDPQEVETAIRDVELESPTPVVCEATKGDFYSSWSSVVVRPHTGSFLEDLVTLCEFRIQSTWLTAYRLNQRASDTSLVRANSKYGLQLQLDGQEFTQIKSRVGQRLGANSPHDATVIVDDIFRTSELAEEMDNAADALELAKARIDFATQRHEAKSKSILEVFGLVFASAGLADLMFSLPINSQTFSADLGPFLVWAAVTLVGIVFVFRQRF